ncbi:biosynthetic-type acetolactate synthase large subunit [Clostridium estertheticum]|uniref:biosynthetic-type acetolactate synthase large subunit n=1 Tax=Clostridium estertheticum TaxID=238834 RepID=UPI001C0BE452|nr:biosynthetic-type acetolactate synthase large subunit [Clostridium estertheticum]MBU3199058.1 biosynthetic-type acetolactate synthase large subunit [Clostridium estertheticum]WAG63676.1 biosynthetic-type acetolactate synthase large subunit [Clostridium estertheticum]
MKAAEAIIKCLQEEKVKIVFGYPGVPVGPLYEALRKSDIEHILVRHEQAAGHSASGYARATRSIGVCIATSGPGAINLITGIATAYADSIPMIAITGQVRTDLIGKDVFQEADIIGATDSFTKNSYLVKDAKDIPRIMKEAFYIARTGRPGPVLVDIPLDIQNTEIEFEYPSEISIRGYKPTVNGNKRQIKKALEKIKSSRKPLICVGGGVMSAKAEQELIKFIEKSKIPMVHTLMGKDGIPSKYLYNVGLIGSHGFKYANKAVAEADVLILVGTRVADRATGGSKSFGKMADIIHIDVDPAEIGKNLSALIPVVGDCKKILQELTDGVTQIDTKMWMDQITTWKKEYVKIRETGAKVNPQYALELLSQMIEEDALITADVGQNQIWTSHYLDMVGNRRFLTSGGLGTMGYSIPASVGCKFAFPKRRVVAVMGDGSFQMSMSELGTIKQNHLNIIFLLFNNSNLGMVREYQSNVYKNTYGVSLCENPDFVKLVESYGLCGKRVNSNSELKGVLEEAMASNKAFLIECIVGEEESTL